MHAPVSNEVTESNGPQKQARHLPPIETRFKPGQSGNPGGRPKGASPRAALRRMLAEKPNEHGEGAETAAIAQRIMEVARSIANGAVDHDKALKVMEAQLRILEQVDGKPVQAIEHTGDVTVRRIVLEDPTLPTDTPNASGGPS